MVNVGVTHDTAEFAVESIRRWWKLAGRHRKQGAKRILICATLAAGTLLVAAGEQEDIRPFFA